MSVTITNKVSDLTRTKRMVMCDLTFDSSYATGGEAPSQGDFKTALGFSSINKVLLGSKNGYQCEYDYTTHKIKTYGQCTMPKVVVQEKHTLDANDQFTLNYPPAYIMDINNGSMPLSLTTSGATLAAGQVKPTTIFVANALTTFTASPSDILGGLGAFTADNGAMPTGWTDSADPDVWTIATNKASKADGASTLTFDTWTAVPGSTYRLAFTLGGTAGAEGVTCTVGGTAGTARTTAAAYTEDIIASAASGLSIATAGATDTLTLDTMTLYERDVYITYVTQGWSEVWDNLVQEETVAVASHNGTLANIPLAFQAVKSTGTTSTNSCLFLDKDDTAATGEVVVFKASNGITFAAADAVTSAVVTYIKKPTSGYLYDRFIAEETLSDATETCYLAKPCLLWGYSSQFVENGQVTNRTIHIDATKQAQHCQFDFRGIAIVTTKGLSRILSDHIQTAGTGYYVWGWESEIPNRGMIEAQSAADLSALTVSAVFIGS